MKLNVSEDSDVELLQISQQCGFVWTKEEDVDGQQIINKLSQISISQKCIIRKGRAPKKDFKGNVDA